MEASYCDPASFSAPSLHLLPGSGPAPRRAASELGRRGDQPAAYTRPAAPGLALRGCVLMRRAALDDVGGLDEGFFLYSEETDLFRRLRDSGWQARFEPRATAYHKGYGSAPCERSLPRYWPGAGSATRASITVRWSAFWRRSAWRSTHSRARPLGFTVPRVAAGIWRPRERRWVRCQAGKHAMSSPAAPVAPRRAGVRALAGIRGARRTRSGPGAGRGRDVRSPRERALRLAHAAHRRRSGNAISRAPPRCPGGPRSDVERSAFNRALVAHLASRLRFRLTELALPTEVLKRVPPALDRLHAFLSKRPTAMGSATTIS